MTDASEKPVRLPARSRQGMLLSLDGVQVATLLAAVVILWVAVSSPLGPLGLLVAALVVVPVGVAHAGAALLSPTVLLIGVAVAAVSSAIPISLEMMALKRLPKEAFGIMISMEPAVAAVLAIGLLNEHLSNGQWLAIGCIVAASMGSALTARRQAPKVAESVAT